jgi:hypothetical protein
MSRTKARVKPPRRPRTKPILKEEGYSHWTLRRLIESLVTKRPIKVCTNAEEAKDGYVYGPVVGLARKYPNDPDKQHFWVTTIQISKCRTVIIRVTVEPDSGPWDI